MTMLMVRDAKRKGPKMMTQQQASEIAMAIIQNEGKSISELSDLQIGMYLVDRSFEETEDNIAAIRKA